MENHDAKLLESFMNTANENPNAFDELNQKAVKKITATSTLESLYQHLPARFPPLYEQLILNYRWPEMDCGKFRLLANPVGDDLSLLLAEITRDKHLSRTLLANGLLQFGRSCARDYDPICFDTRNRGQNADCPILSIDHEEILCKDRIKIVAKLASSFRNFIQQTISTI